MLVLATDVGAAVEMPGNLKTHGAGVAARGIVADSTRATKLSRKPHSSSPSPSRTSSSSSSGRSFVVWPTSSASGKNGSKCQPPPAKKMRRGVASGETPPTLREVIKSFEAKGIACSCHSIAEAAAARAAAGETFRDVPREETVRLVPPRQRSVSEVEVEGLAVAEGQRDAKSAVDSARGSVAGCHTRGRTAHNGGVPAQTVEDAERSVCGAAAEYLPLAKCLKRLHYLRNERGRSRKRARRWLATLAIRLTEVPPGLAVGVPRTGGLGPPRPANVRFVALSDTHRYHEQVDVPAGEVLLYAGDAVGNYGRSSDLSRHLDDFFKWLWSQSRRFAHVFFIAGNHETLLDDDHSDATQGVRKMQKFLASTPNCTYLQNSSTTYRGLRIYGSPVTVSRQEMDGKRYYSRAFERTREKRAALWASLPEGLDLLMTHGPPVGRLSNYGDPLLTERCASMKRPPRYHVFGHDHDFIGIDSNERTVFLNVAQDECLRNDPGGGGCALIFDIPARDG